MTSRLIAGVTAVAAVLTLAAGGGVSRAQVDPCPPPAYPGDAASKDAIAQWMAYGASVAALPRELPVMAALVESELQNLRVAGADSVGYFQMRASVWNQGAYAGYPDHPELQLKWFIDRATATRRSSIAAGGADPAAAEADWGSWIADVQRPPETGRGRYQLRLDEARALIGAACVPSAADGSVPPPPVAQPPAADTTAPAAELAGRERQRALRRGAIVMTVACPGEPCRVFATATVRLPRARRPPQLASNPRTISAGERRTVPFALRGEIHARLRKALRSRPSVAITVRIRAVDAAGNAATRTRTVRITG